MFNFFYGLLLAFRRVRASRLRSGLGRCRVVSWMGHLGIVELDIQIPHEVGLTKADSYKQNVMQIPIAVKASCHRTPTVELETNHRIPCSSVRDSADPTAVEAAREIAPPILIR